MSYIKILEKEEIKTKNHEKLLNNKKKKINTIIINKVFYYIEYEIKRINLDKTRRAKAHTGTVTGNRANA